VEEPLARTIGREQNARAHNTSAPEPKPKHQNVKTAIGNVLLGQLPISTISPAPRDHFSPQQVMEMREKPEMREYYEAVSALMRLGDSPDESQHASALERQAKAKTAAASLLGLDPDGQTMARIQVSLAAEASKRLSQKDLSYP
jgi:hypothetical protein